MNLEKLKNRHGQIWLNIGSGFYFLDDFVNVDSNYMVFAAPFYPITKYFVKEAGRHWMRHYNSIKHQHKFLFANCRYPLKFPPNSVDHILISHFLEHLHYDHAVAVLRNYFSILRPGGTLHIIVPDVGQKAEEYVSKLGDPAATEAFVEWLNFEKRRLPRFAVRLLRLTGWFDMEHCWLYDVPSLSKVVREIGFNILEKDDSPSASWRREDPCQVNILVQKPAS
jgi:SAM-dependent methyltransferase